MEDFPIARKDPNRTLEDLWNSKLFRFGIVKENIVSVYQSSFDMT